MAHDGPRFGPQDTPRRDQSGAGTDQHIGHEPQHARSQNAHEHGGRSGHNWMMVACCVPMLLIAAALVLSGTAGVGVIVWALGCTLIMALMMGGMGGHHHGGRDQMSSRQERRKTGGEKSGSTKA